MAKNVTDADLMLFADGELSGNAAKDVESEVGSSTVARERVEAVKEVGEVVRIHLERAADEAAERGAFDDLWNRIEAGIDAPARVVPSQPERGLWAAFLEWWHSFHGHVLTGAGVAVATLLLVMVVRPFEREVQTTVQVQGPVGMVPAALEAQAPEVEDLEIYDGEGMILTVEGDDGEAPTTVIWLQETEPSVEGPL